MSLASNVHSFGVISLLVYGFKGNELELSVVLSTLIALAHSNFVKTLANFKCCCLTIVNVSKL